MLRWIFFFLLICFYVYVYFNLFPFFELMNLTLLNNLHIGFIIKKLLTILTVELPDMCRYASKENDTWIRALVKDLTVEAGSGLIVLDPVDISGGYTSLKDKTNMSLISTNICIHLSLSAISLILSLQNQAFAALQFGNMIPLAPCTHFDRIWVSSKGLFHKFPCQQDLFISH